MSTFIKIDAYLDGKSCNPKLYRSMIGLLLYFTASRPVLLFSVCLCARYQSALKESKMITVKRTFRYLKDTSCLGICFLKDLNFTLHAYSYADYVGCCMERKSTSGAFHFLGSMLVSWSLKK